MPNTPYLPVFTTPAAEAETMAVYQSMLARWPVPFTEMMIPTSFGDTHVIASGPEGAPPVILLHAFYASVLTWLPTAGGLSGDFRVYAVDVLGEPGRSRPTQVIKTLDEQMQWLKELTDGLGAPKADVVGNSFGGYFSLAYALRMPERVRKLVLIAPASTIHSMWPFYLNAFLPKFLLMFFPWFPGLRRWCLHSVDWMRNGAPTDPQWEELFKLIMQYGTGTRYLFPAVFPPEDLRRVATPTLLMIGDKEVIYPPEAAIRAAKKHMPNLRSAVIPNANHIASLSQPELVNEQIRTFLCMDES
jgi:pimeloyl-ACP methyl ester carboxylesterase